MSAIHSLTIFFPMFNEAGNIKNLISHLEDVLPNLEIPDIEILFLDGGSQDGSDATAAAWGEQRPAVRLIREPPNMSYAMAIRSGYEQGRGEALFYTDSDLPVDLNDIRLALPLLDSADLVIGYRTDRQETLKRAVFSVVYNKLVRILFGVKVRDVNFSFKLVSRKVLGDIRLTAKTGFIDGELLAEACRCGFRIKEIPIDYIPRSIGTSRFDRVSTAVKIFLDMMRYWAARQKYDR